MLNKIYDKAKKIIKNNLSFIFTIIILFLLFYIELPYYINAPGSLINLEDKTNIEQAENEIVQQNENIINEEIPKNMPTEVISEKNLTERATNEYTTVKIKNETDYELTEDILNPEISLNSKDILIF